MWNAVDHHNDNNPVDENASSSGSATPPLPIRAPAPPPSSTFARSQSLGKPEVVTTKESDSVALSLLGRHTHHYPPSKLPDSEPNRVLIKNYFKKSAKHVEFLCNLAISRKIITMFLGGI